MNILGYFLGVSALGILVGYLVALSASPVVGALLPLLFSLLGGAGAIYAAKLDLRNAHDRAKLNIAGGSLACFAVGIMVSSVVALRYRDHVPPLPLNVSNNQTSQQVDHALQLAKLRRQLQLLGTTDAETTRILASAPSVTALAADDGAKMAEKAQNIAKSFAAINKRIIVVTDADERLRKSTDNLKAAMSYLELALPVTANQLRSNEVIASRVLDYQLAYAKYVVQELTGGGTAAVWNASGFEKISNNADMLSALLETRAVLEAYEVRFSKQTISPSFFKTDASSEQKEKQTFPLNRLPIGIFAQHRRPENDAWKQFWPQGEN